MRRRGALTVRALRHVAVAAALITHVGVAGAQAGTHRRAPSVAGALASLDAAARERQAARESKRFDTIFQKYAKRYFGAGTDWRWFKAQGMAESDLSPTARSRVGARGIMQLMPSTYGQIKSALPQFGAIDDPQWNIAAGILHDRDLWTLWNRDVPEDQRWAFMFASYNAGEGTIMRARRTAAAEKLDQSRWPAIERVAPKVERWRYSETLGYVRTITANKDALGTTP
ncbi:MAG: transglycosylase SLT domain-containing protein [Gemmatimonadetes bacterium]|nr:transglycosylase SLT domain-containing protein [Gemmatimonadota bacterium]